MWSHIPSLMQYHRWRYLIAFLLHYMFLRTLIGIVFAFTLNWFDIRATCYCHDVWPVFVKENSIRCHPFSTQCNDASPNCHLCAGVSPHKGNVASAQLSLEMVVIRGDHPNFYFDPNPIQRANQCHLFWKSLKSLSSWRCLSVSSPYCLREGFGVSSIVAAALAASRSGCTSGSVALDRMARVWRDGLVMVQRQPVTWTNAAVFGPSVKKYFNRNQIIHENIRG